MIPERDKVYVLKENDILTIRCVLAGLQVALNAVIASRSIDPSAPGIRSREVARFDHLVDQVLEERDKDLCDVPDLF